MDIIQNKPKLYNRNYVYLQLLEKRLKKYEYLENNNITETYFSSEDNSYLLEQDYSNIEHSNNYRISSRLTKSGTIILKQLLEQNIYHDKIFIPHFIKICSDQEIHNSLKKIKLRYIGFKKYYNIYESISIKKNDFHITLDNDYLDKEDYHDYIYCLDQNKYGTIWLDWSDLIFFEVLDNYFDKKYIFYSSLFNEFYKTNEFIKLDYIAIDNCELQLQILKKYISNFKYPFVFLNDQGNHDINSLIYFEFDECETNIDNFKNFYYDISIKEAENLYYKVTYTKGIQKNE
ncbi:hypothetical protein Hokovirus_5_8 [Hokovirus HKV1]|uniref:Uncharacterized protein n=1 Tax=Hokovirus HKV1 TaxID=1977638 RepID=A0A1V0SHB8_9VIRU|nr:hypothetical protein Hokovirus_5_8 [Hokovirus HKV1]